MKRVVLLLIVALLFATMTWVDSSARDTPWGMRPDRDTGDDHPWGGEQLRPDDGPSLSTISGGTTFTRYFLVDLLSGYVVNVVSSWNETYRLYQVPSDSNTGNTGTTGQQTQSTTPSQGQ